MRHLGILVVAVVAALLTSVTSFAIGPQVPLVNSSAEAGPASVDGMTGVLIPGWTASGVPTVVEYGTPGPFPVRENEVPGVNDQLFVGGPAPGQATLSQSVSIPEEALAFIDSGKCGISANARLGGWQSDLDSARVVVEVMDDQGSTLTTLIVGPVTAGDRGGLTVLKERYQLVAIPVGSRTVSVRLELNGVDGAYNNALADDIYVSIEYPDPVLPATWGSVKLVEWSAQSSP